MSKTDGVKQMSIGLVHRCFVTQKGDLFCSGADQWGQCGIAPPRKRGQMGSLEEPEPFNVELTQVKLPEEAAPIANVVVGGAHTVAMDEKGRTLSFGDDRRIQLGLGDTRSIGKDERNAHGVILMANLGGVKTSKEIRRTIAYKYYDPHMQASPVGTMPPPAVNRPPYPPASFVSAGENFTIFVHRDSPDWYSKEEETNTLFCSGENFEGQCGRNLAHQQQPWAAARTPARSQCVAVASGDGHSLALLSNGDLYTWGWNRDGQLGTGKRASVVTPVRVPLRPDNSPQPKAAPVMYMDDGTMAYTAPPEENVGNIPRRERPIVTSIVCGCRNSAVICDVPQL